MNCFISNCVDGNDYINYKAVMIVKQPTHLMVPLKLEGQWFDDYELKILYEFNGLISQPKRFTEALRKQTKSEEMGKCILCKWKSKESRSKLYFHWRRKWQPIPVFLPEKSSWTEEPSRLQSMRSQSRA